ncbi:MAG: DUF2437 domain-containing protein [Chromatiales bacterium]|nr:DUF2437 domain-containing protein [Chromatiales bacterium]
MLSAPASDRGDGRRRGEPDRAALDAARRRTPTARRLRPGRSTASTDPRAGSGRRLNDKPLSEPRFEDADFVFGRAYRYVVRAVAAAEETAESEDAVPLDVQPRDVFPAGRTGRPDGRGGRGRDHPALGPEPGARPGRLQGLAPPDRRDGLDASDARARGGQRLHGHDPRPRTSSGTNTRSRKRSTRPATKARAAPRPARSSRSGKALEFARFRHGRETGTGLLEEGRIRPVVGSIFEALSARRADPSRLQEAMLLAPVLPSKIAAVGLNYKTTPRSGTSPCPTSRCCLSSPRPRSSGRTMPSSIRGCPIGSTTRASWPSRRPPGQRPDRARIGPRTTSSATPASTT